jgi:phosphoglucomutase
MQRIMAAFRQVKEIGGQKVESCKDYAPGIDGLPPSDVLKFRLDGGASVVVRPSGTEPKLKTYVSVSAANEEKAREEEKKLTEALTAFMHQ